MEDKLLVNLGEIFLSLKEIKKLEAIGHNQAFNKLGFTICINVRDENKREYSLLGYHISDLKYLHTAKTQFKYLKSLHHPNLIKFFEEFTIGQYSFILTQRIHTCLLDWIHDTAHNNPISELHCVDIALQMLEVTHYINTNNYALPLQSTLSCFSIDNEMKIKLLKVDIPFKPFNITKIQSIFKECRQKNELFYFRKETVCDAKLITFQQSYHFDLHAIGICLYYLSGIPTQRILNYLEGSEPFIFSKTLGFQNNVILHSILYRYNQNQYKPSFSHLIGSLYTAQKSLQIERNPETNKEYHLEQVLQDDVERFVRVHNSLYTRQNTTPLNDIDYFDKLLSKYGQVEQILDLQSKLYYSTQDLNKAIQKQENILKINPLSDLAYFTLAAFYSQNDQSKLQKKYLKESIRINKFNDGCIQNIGHYFKEKQSYYKALEQYQRSLKVNPNNLDSLQQLGYSMKKYMQFKQSIYCFKNSLELEQNTFSLYQLSCIYCFEDKYDKAIRNTYKYHEDIQIINSYKEAI